MKHLYFVVLLLLFTATPLFPHDNHIKFDHLTVADGLSSDAILAVWQDSRGFMWFGTLDGLNRYDGHSFKVYRYDPQDSRSLSSNVCWDLYTDRSGDLWIGNFAGGLNKFDYTTESFTRFRHDPENLQSISEDWINVVYEDLFGTFWIGTETRGLNKFDGKTDRFSHYCPDPSDPITRGAEFVLEIYEPPSDDSLFWLGTRRGIALFNRQTGTFSPMTYDTISGKAMTLQKVSNIYRDDSGILWIGTRGDGLIKYDLQKGKLAHYKHNPADPFSLSHNSIQPDGIRADPDHPSDFLWIPTRGGGINKFEKRSGKFFRYQHDEKDPTSLSGYTIWGLYFDNIGTLWVGTVRDGVNKFSRLKEKFYPLHPNHNFPENENLRGVSVIFKSRSGIFWLGTLGYGLYRWDTGTGRVTRYQHDSQNVKSISSNRIWGIDEDSYGNLWLATGGGGLNKLDNKTNQFSHYQCNPEGPYHVIQNDLRDVLIDSEDNLWVASRDGLCKFDRINEKYKRFKHDPADPYSISNNRIWGLFEDSRDTLWILTEGGGLNKFNSKSETFRHFRHNPADPFSISNDCIYDICEVRDSSGSYFWLATGDGLNKMDIATEKFWSYGLNEGLPATNLESLVVDDHRVVWVQTYKGISRFDPQTETFRNFDVNDGIPTPIANPLVCYKCENGELFFGARQGLICIHPDSIKNNPHVPPIYLTDFKVLNQPYHLDSSITEIKQIELPHNQNFFSFEFAALDYVAPSKNQYAYQLEGLDQDWIYCGSRHSANYTDVRPGSYVFWVKGSNNDGLWNEQGTSVSIIIYPPWWQSSWAYGLYVIIFLAVMYGFRRYDLKRQRLKAQLELEHQHAQRCEELEHLKSRFFSNISHEFRTPLTLILGPIKQWITKIKDMDLKQDMNLVQRNAERLLQLINQLLDLSKLEAGKMQLQVRLTNLTDFLKPLVLSLASLAERKCITLNFVQPAEMIMAYIDQEMVEKIVTNLLSNAFKFCPEGGRVEVKILNPPVSPLIHKGGIKGGSGESFQLRISDSGPGIPPDKLPHLFDRFYRADDSYARNQEGTGIGLALTKELVELHHGEISVESELGRGSTFTVWLPVGKEHLGAEEIVTATIPDARYQMPDAGLPTANCPMPTPYYLSDKKTRYKVQDTRKLSVLIVEDHPDMLRYMRGYLENCYWIMESGDGKTGVEMALEKLPDLIISDVMMPRMDGFVLCQKLKTDERTSHIPIILLTARADVESKLEGLETGADDYLTKPFDARELQVRVHNLIEQRRKLRESFSQQTAIQPKEITVTSMDEQFLQRAMDILELHISDARFSIEDFSYEIGFSQRHLNRKLQALTNLPARDFIRTLRLQRARQLLQQKSATIMEIAYEVGFNNPSHFSKCFKKQFGQSPSEFVAGRG